VKVSPGWARWFGQTIPNVRNISKN
jgi:hypothetical protein